MSSTASRSCTKQRSPIFNDCCKSPVEKSVLVTKHTFGWIAMWTNLIAVYGTIPTHTRFTRWQWTPKKLRFGADFGPVVSLVCIFLKMTLVRPSSSIMSVTERWQIIIFFAKIKQYGCRQHVVPAGQRCVPYLKHNNQRSTWTIWSYDYLSQKWCELAT